jgi:hypothetical protein
MKSLKLLTLLSALALAPATGAFADSPNNPNCSPGTVGCAANYPTTDHSDVNPTKQSTSNSAPMSPNCSPGQQGCQANYPTTDHSDQNPLKQGTPASSPAK